MSILKSKSHEIRLPHSRKGSLISIDNLSTTLRATDHTKSSMKSNESTSEINVEPDSSKSSKSRSQNLRYKIKEEFPNKDSLKESVEHETQVFYLDEGQMNNEGLQNPSNMPQEMSDFSRPKSETDYEKRKQFEKTLMDAEISQCRNPEIDTGNFSSFQVFLITVCFKIDRKILHFNIIIILLKKVWIHLKKTSGLAKWRKQ